MNTGITSRGNEIGASKSRLHGEGYSVLCTTAEAQDLPGCPSQGAETMFSGILYTLKKKEIM